MLIGYDAISSQYRVGEPNDTFFPRSPHSPGLRMTTACLRHHAGAMTRLRRKNVRSPS